MMKSFLLFLKLLFLNLFVVSFVCVLVERNFDSFTIKIVLFTTFFFSLISFSYVYIFDKYKTSKSLKFRILISVVFMTILMFLLGYIIQILLHKNIYFTTLLYQSILAICIFIFEVLIINFYTNFEKKYSLIFSDKPLYYLKIILIISLTESLLYGITTSDIIINDFANKNLLKFLSFVFLFPLLTMILCFFGLKYLSKIKFIKSNKIYLISLTILIGSLAIYVIRIDKFRFNILEQLLGFIPFSTFNTLILFEIITYRDKLNNSLKKYNFLSKAFSKKEAEYIQLKNQINPHFLFNNLNILISFIETNPKKAVEFGHHLSNTYRHYLKNENEDFISLSEELFFIKEYLEIYKAKFEQAFTFEIKVNSDENDFILTLALQEIVDNIFKHNILEDVNPLQINITKCGQILEIKNTINQNNNVKSNQFGLKNIKKRYEFLSKQIVEVYHDENIFIVKIPILNLVK